MDVLIVIGIFLLLFVVVALIVVLSRRIIKVGPNEVLVISGRGKGRTDELDTVRSNFRIVTGGRAFVWPILERVDDLSLELMTIDITTPDVPTIQGVKVTVDGVAQVKIGSDESSIRTAAIQFLSRSQDQIEYVAHETLAGHLRAILGTLTVEQLYRDREAFAQKVQEVSGEDMASMGMDIISFVIKDIKDDEGYLEALGRPRIAQVKRDAAIGEAEAARDATIESARARQEGESAKFAAETKIAESRKDYEIEQAAFEAQTNRKRAEAELAYTLQQNIENQKIKEEEVQIEVVEKQKQIQVQEQEAERMERELQATVRKPAEAEEYRIRTLANARQYQLQTEATGEAEAIRQRGEAEADAEKARGLAQAEVTRQQGLAEAEATARKADAWERYTQAAVLQQILDKLPEMATAIAQPLSKTDRIVIISNGDNGQGVGASRVTDDVTRIIAQVPSTIEALTGVDLTQSLQNLPGLKQSEEAAGNGAAEPAEPAEPRPTPTEPAV
ncbi:MAG: SPFH domain-containing protein [Candidatus Promineifilaceae bacterium]|nr:SPFH domain-containing protein [Candidatus Promineifilaceae bacterium]